MGGVAQPGDHRLAGFLFDLADTIFELQPMRGDIASGQRRVDGAQLPHQCSARLFVDSAASGPVILWQGFDRPA